MIRSQWVRPCLWIALAAGIAAALWCLDLVLFHWWAAYAPPQDTDWHVGRARWSAVALVAAVAWVGIVVRSLYVRRSGP